MQYENPFVKKEGIIMENGGGAVVVIISNPNLCFIISIAASGTVGKSRRKDA